MPYYPMKCSFHRCSQEFDYFTKPDLYEISKRDGFRDDRCTKCGAFGTMERFYPSDSAPANLTVKGTWGKHASPELKGKDFYTKQERDRQLAAIGRVSVQDDEGLNPKKNHAATTYEHDGESLVEATTKRAKRETVYDEDAVRPKKKAKKKAKKADDGPRPTDIIRQFAEDSGGLFSYQELIESTGEEPKRMLGGIISGIKTGWLAKGDTEKTYRLTSHA